MRVLLAAAVVLFALAVGAPSAGAGGSGTELQQLDERIWDDYRALTRLGIYLESSSVEEERDRIVVSVITRRGDAQEVMTERYGDKVRVKVIARRRYSHVRTRWDEYTPLRGGTRLRIWWLTNSAFKLERVRVREGRKRVVITVIERAPNGNVTQAGEYRNHLVRLRRPLGGRVVVDGANGKRRHAGPGVHW
jgi:hypothetical protein